MLRPDVPANGLLVHLEITAAWGTVNSSGIVIVLSRTA